MSQELVNNKVGILLYNKRLTDFIILIHNGDDIITIRPKDFCGDMMKLQGTIDTLVKPILTSDSYKFTTVSDIPPMKPTSPTLPSIEYTHA